MEDKQPKKIPRILLLIVYIFLFFTFFVLYSILTNLILGPILSGIPYSLAFYLIISFCFSTWTLITIDKYINNEKTDKLNTGSANSLSDPQLVKQKNKPLGIFLAVIVVLSGLAVGFFVGGLITFSACFKSECNTFERTAPITLPAASLLFTVPVASRIVKSIKSNPPSSNAASSSPPSSGPPSSSSPSSSPQDGNDQPKA